MERGKYWNIFYYWLFIKNKIEIFTGVMLWERIASSAEARVVHFHCTSSPLCWIQQRGPVNMRMGKPLEVTSQRQTSSESWFSHPGTNQARPCVASEIRRDGACSGWYGCRQGPVLKRRTQQANSIKLKSHKRAKHKDKVLVFMLKWQLVGGKPSLSSSNEALGPFISLPLYFALGFSRFIMLG